MCEIKLLTNFSCLGSAAVQPESLNQKKTLPWPSAAFILVSSALGAGSLNFPYAFCAVGIAPAIALEIVRSANKRNT